MRIQPAAGTTARLAASLLPLALVQPAQAQISTLDINDTVSAAETLVPLGTSTDFSAVAVGDLDDNLDKELIYLVNGDLLVFPNVTASSASFLLSRSQPVLDLAVQSVENGPDRLVVLQASGVAVLNLTFDYAAQSVTVASEVLYSDAALQSATAVEACHVGGGEEPDLVVLGSDQKSVRVLTDIPGSPGTLSLSSTLQGSALHPSWAMELIDFQSGSLTEVALLGSHGLEILTLDGSPGVFHGHLASAGSICALKTNSSNAIAWAREFSAGIWELVIVEPSGAGVPSTPFGTGAVTSLAAADLDADGVDQELLASYASANQLRVVDMEAGAVVSTFTVQNSRVPGVGNHAELAITDFDQDGFPDVALGDSGEQALDLYLNDKWPNVIYDQTPTVYYLSLRAQRDWLVWKFDQTQSEGMGYPHGANRLQVRVFNMVPGPVAGWNAPIALPLPANEQVLDWTAVPHGIFPRKAPGVGSDYVTFFEARFIHADSSGNVTKHFPINWFALVDDDNQAAIDYLEDAYPFRAFNPNSIGDGDATGGGTTPPKNNPPGPGGG